jgi:hypothetical protein
MLQNQAGRNGLRRSRRGRSIDKNPRDSNASEKIASGFIDDGAEEISSVTSLITFAPRLK